MALIPEQPYVLARLSDASDSRAELRVHIRRGSEAAAALAAASTLAALAAGASSCVAVEQLARYPVKVAPQLAPQPGSNRFLVGLLIFNTSSPGQYGLVEIPGIRINLVKVDDPNELDITAPPLAALIAYITGNGFTNPFGYPLISCIGGLFQLRR